jgi:hypothetical protein
LVGRIVWVLGSVAPADVQDSVVRDLVADTFDFLLAWRRAILEAQLSVGYPLGRRAYESLSLLSVCAQDTAVAARWYKGAQIGNADIRSALARLPFRESEADLRELYRFFSKGSHPNRDLIPERYPGAGNDFVLGSIGRPDLLLLIDHCLNLLRMWFWFGAAAGYFYRRRIDAQDPEWGRDYLREAKRAEEIAVELTNEFNRLLGERSAS